MYTTLVFLTRSLLALQQADPECPLDMYETLLAKNPFMQRWVMTEKHEEDQKALAHVVFQAIETEAEVVALFVCPRYRRKGYAQKLLDQLCTAYETVYLDVRVSNKAALALYEKKGFQQSGVRKNYYPNGESAIQMCWKATGLG